MYKPKGVIIIFLMIIVINLISTLNQLLLANDVLAYGDKKDKIRYKDGDYKVYTDYLVQNPLKYGKIESDIQNDNFQNHNDFDEHLDQHNSLYLNSKCAKCKDTTEIENFDMEFLISEIEKNIED